MKTVNRVKIINVVCSLLLLTAYPQYGMAQHFGHGGGGGGRGGGFRGGGGGRTINGGSRDFGNHTFRAPVNQPRQVRPFVNVHPTESIFHHGDGLHPYAYHPYRPYIWGPFWHPLGFFAAALTADAIMLSIDNQQYYYDNGVYYSPSGNGYTVVPPPVGAVVTYLPAGYLSVPVGDAMYYYYGGAFYISQGGSFRVVPAPLGAIVTEIPDGATQQVINGVNYLLYNNTYYEPISQDGQDAYEVVQVN